MAYALAVWLPSYLGSFALLSWKVQALMAFIILSIFMSIVFSAVAMEMFSVASAGAGVSLLGIVGTFTTTGICGRGTPGGIEYGVTAGVVCAPSESRRVRASVVGNLSRTWFWSFSYLTIEGSLGSSSSFITAFALKSLRRAPSNISTCEYSVMPPLLIIMRLMLL